MFNKTNIMQSIIYRSIHKPYESLFILQFVYCLECRDFSIIKDEASYANTALYHLT